MTAAQYFCFVLIAVDVELAIVIGLFQAAWKEVIRLSQSISDYLRVALRLRVDRECKIMWGNRKLETVCSYTTSHMTLEDYLLWLRIQL